jgi:hypothetical protein
MEPGCILAESHVDAAWSVDEIPQTNKNNPIPGQFLYSLPATIPIASLAGTPDGTVAVAVHGVAVTLSSSGLCTSCDVDALAALLPECAAVYVDYPGAASYFDMILVGAGMLDGPYNGWCADALEHMDDVVPPMDPQPVLLFPSYPYSGIPAGVVDYPENLPKVNWLVNQPLVAPNTIGDVQQAIWRLLWGVYPGDAYGCGNASWGGYDDTLARAEALRLAAEAHGDFVPGCDDVVLVVLVPVDDCETPELPDERHRQPLLIELPNACSETCWGVDQTIMPPNPSTTVKEFDGKNWAFWINYILIF